KFIAVLENFKYVFRGGRAPFLGRFISSIIRFMPILTIGSNGKVQLKKFVRNKESGIIEIFKQTKALISCSENNKIGIFYGSDISPALKLEKMIREDKSIKTDEIILTEITTIMVAHTGPGIFGVAVTNCPNLE
ncbi:unnamed protein product, partial [marine sediment metagenome]